MSVEEEKKNIKCPRCKCWAYPRDFFHETNGRKLISCAKCRKASKASREKNKCEHGRRKDKCIDCAGSSICEHKRQKAECKKCMNSAEQKKYIIQRMIRSSRQSDKKSNRYDADNFIDKCFLEGLFEDNEECYYCKVPFTYEERCSTLVTIERLKNSTGHIKSNCVLACFTCNLKHQSKD